MDNPLKTTMRSLTMESTIVFRLRISPASVMIETKGHALSRA